MNAEEYKKQLEERRLVSYSTKERLLIICVPFYVTWLKAARLNGEGYKLLYGQYWLMLTLRYAILLALTFIVALLCR